MGFEKEKKDTLGRKDKSKKGAIDEAIKPIVDFINSLDNYYTTSSCSGRILLLAKKSDSKKDVEWLLSSHSVVKFSDIMEALKKLPMHAVWFRQEPAILHVRCRTIEDAQALVDIARYSGFKRSGIQSTRKKINVEIGNSEVLYTIIADKGGLLAAGDYLKILISEANKKLRRNKEKLRRFYKEIKKLK
jgi:tRNA wybutosine-synthesizing protein 3